MAPLFRHARFSKTLLAALLIAACAPSADAPLPDPEQPEAAAVALEWSRFRGPNGSGVSEAAGFPVEFGPELNVAWSTEVPFGRSSPIVDGDRVYLTASNDEALITLALDRNSGELLWQREIAPDRDDEMYQSNDPASPTPATDGDSVFVFFQEVGLVSYDTEGDERWRVELGPYDNFYGLSASPVIAGDVVLLLCDQVVGSFLLAVDKETGAERWRMERGARLESWSTPILYPNDEPEAVLVFGSNWVDSYDLHTGEPRWALPGVGGGPIASPVVSGSMMVLTAPNHAEEPLPSYSTLTAGADENGDGELAAAEFANIEGLGGHFGWVDRNNDDIATEQEWQFIVDLVEASAYGIMGISLPEEPGAQAPEIVWTNQQSIPYIATPLVYEGIVYVVRDGGIVQSIDLATGEVFKRGRTSSSAGSVYASPVAADGKILISTLEGEIAVLQAGEQWEVLAVNDLDEPLFASPALVGDRILVRTPTRLYSFGFED